MAALERTTSQPVGPLGRLASPRPDLELAEPDPGPAGLRAPRLVVTLPAAVRRRWNAIALEQLCERAMALEEENDRLRLDVARAEELAVRAALHYLERASDAWRNGDPREGGPLHWPVAVAEARRALEGALEAPRESGTGADGTACDSATCATSPAGDPDAEVGIAWWNRITRAERAHWLQVADSAVPADAWEAYKRGAAHRRALPSMPA